jgi:hypothetical protein
MYLHSNSTQSLGYKERQNHEKKSFQKKHIFSNLYFMQLFSADAIVFSKKINIFFDPQKVKKRASKVAHNRPNFFFHSPAQTTAHSRQPTAQNWFFII